MAGNASTLLQVNPYSLAGQDFTGKSAVIEGTILPLPAPGSLLSIAINVAGTGWGTNDTFTIAGGTGGIGKVTAQSGGIPSAISISANGSGYSAATGAVTTAVSPSTGVGLTVNTTVNVGNVISITAWAIVSNVLTFTAVNSLTGGGGQVIDVYGFTGAQYFLNGTYTTSSATATTIVVPLTHANGSGTQQGVAALQGTYTTGGIPISYAFVDMQGLPNPLGLIGPLSVPKWIDVQSNAGSALNYKVNTTVSPHTLLIFNGITQLADQAVITFDTAGFRAEFVKNAF